MADQILITDTDAVKTIEKYAEQKGISKAEAGARLVRTAKGRINAVRKYAAEHPRKSIKKPKPAAKAKPPVKRAAKAKPAPAQESKPETPAVETV